MCSTIDNVECPNCGTEAQIDKDNHSTDSTIFCVCCGYEEVNGTVENEGREQEN